MPGFEKSIVELLRIKLESVNNSHLRPDSVRHEYKTIGMTRGFVEAQVSLCSRSVTDMVSRQVDLVI